jgi:hypothetical protein
LKNIKQRDIPVKNCFCATSTFYTTTVTPGFLVIISVRIYLRLAIDLIFLEARWRSTGSSSVGSSKSRSLLPPLVALLLNRHVSPPLTAHASATYFNSSAPTSRSTRLKRRSTTSSPVSAPAQKFTPPHLPPPPVIDGPLEKTSSQFSATHSTSRHNYTPTPSTNHSTLTPTTHYTPKT